MADEKRGPGRPKGLSNSAKRDARTQLRIVQFYVKGLSFKQIKDMMLDEHQEVVSLDRIKKIVDAEVQVWRETQKQLMMDHKAYELMRINNLEYEAMTAWEKSKKPIVTRYVKLVRKEGARGFPAMEVIDPSKPEELLKLFEAEEVREQTRQTAGDVRYLLLVNQCIKQRQEMLGYDPVIPKADPGQHNVTNQYLRQIVFKVNKTTDNG
jgi:hypothetical protein